MACIASGGNAEEKRKPTIQVGTSVTDVGAVVGGPNWLSYGLLLEVPYRERFSFTAGIRKEGFVYWADGDVVDGSFRWHRSLPLGVDGFAGIGASFGIVTDAYSSVEFTEDENGQRTWHRWKFVRINGNVPFVSVDSAFERGSTFYPFLSTGLSRHLWGPLSVHGEFRLGFPATGLQEVRWDDDTRQFNVIRDSRGRGLMPFWRLALGYSF
jgi:hypothetical protein